MKKDTKRKYVKRNRSFELDVQPKRSNTDVSSAELEQPILNKPGRQKMYGLLAQTETGLDKQREATEQDIEQQYQKSVQQANNAVDQFYKTQSNIKEPLRQQPVQQVVRKPINNIKRSQNNIKPVVQKQEKPLKTTTQTETNGQKEQKDDYMNIKWGNEYKFKPYSKQHYIYSSNDQNVKNVKQVKKSSAKNNTGGIVTSVINTAKAIAKNAIQKNDKLYNISHTLFDDAPLGVKYDQIVNGVSGMINKKWGNKNEKYVSKAVQQKTTKLQPLEDFSDIYDKDEVTKEFIGDTAHLENERYALAQVKRLDNLKFAHQNRPKTRQEYDNLKDIPNSGGLLVSTFDEFEPIENARKHDLSGTPRWGQETSSTTYIGVGKHDKKIYVGDLKDMSDSTYVSPAGKVIFKGFATNNDGSVKLVSSPGNSWAKSPLAIVQSSKDSTKTIQIPSSILIGQHGKSMNAYGYGSNNGGKYIVATKHGNILVQGSPRFVMNHLERLRKNQKDGKLTLIELDPGSYVKGMLKRNNVYTRQDQLDYFAQNVAGGHGLYTINNTTMIKPKRNNKK